MGFFKWMRETLATESVLAKHKHEFFSMRRWSKASEKFKTDIRAGFDKRSLAIQQAENPLLALREEMQSSGLMFAHHAVLCASGWEIPSRFSGCPYISAELEHHLDACAQHDPKLLDHWLHLKNSPEAREGHSLQEAMFSGLVTLSLISNFQLQGFNLMRVTQHDYEDQDHDWFDALVLSCLIYAEDDYRGKIGLPLLGASNHYWLAALVGRGLPNPLVQWERIYGQHPIRTYPRVN
jgi:hypothetical protein